MGAPSQVRMGLCVAAATFGLSIAGAFCTMAQAPEVRTSCIDPSAYVRSVVSITRYFDEARRSGGKEIFGERATAWFYTSPRLLVTAGHFASQLLPEGWQDVELRQASPDGNADLTVQAQLRVVIRGAAAEGQGPSILSAPGFADDVAIMELRDPFPNAQVLDVGTEIPPSDTKVLVLGYPDGRVQAARGVIREVENLTGKYTGLTLLEVQGNNRLLLGGGTSGAPVLDCSGRVVGVLNALLTSPALPFLPAGQSPIPTPRGSPTNAAVPASTLSAIRNCIL